MSLASGPRALGGYMGKKLYVGNLPYSMTDDKLKDLFSQAGNVESAKVITDRMSGRSKGFGFVEMSTDAEAQEAINKLNGQNFDGRPVNISEARPQVPREGGGGGGYGGGGGGYGGGGGGGGRGGRDGGRGRRDRW